MHDKDEMECRLMRIESDLRKWKLTATTSMCGLLAIVLMGAADMNPLGVFDEVRTKRLAIVGNDGQPLATLAAQDGRVTLVNQPQPSASLAAITSAPIPESYWDFFYSGGFGGNSSYAMELPSQRVSGTFASSGWSLGVNGAFTVSATGGALLLGYAYTRQNTGLPKTDYSYAQSFNRADHQITLGWRAYVR